MSSSTFSFSATKRPILGTPSRPSHRPDRRALSKPPIATCCRPSTRNGRAGAVLTRRAAPSRRRIMRAARYGMVQK
eukprot:scaffold20339_cov120-Isochrysis_galbana.AAC.7